MPDDSKRTNTDNKLENPASHFEKPSKVANDKRLSRGEKEEALEAWEQDARQLLTASNEGMIASDEGIARDGVHLDDVVRAKEAVAERPKTGRLPKGTPEG
jgi:hypothetical protein